MSVVVWARVSSLKQEEEGYSIVLIAEVRASSISPRLYLGIFKLNRAESS